MIYISNAGPTWFDQTEDSNEAYTYDVECDLPIRGKFLEICNCSNNGDLYP